MPRLLAAVCLWALPVLLCADEYELDAPLALRGATIVAAPGQSFDAGTVLVVRGRIAAVGADVTLPPGTRVIDAAGMHVYAGFIDGFSRIGVNDPKDTEDDEKRAEGEALSITEGPLVAMPEANRNGIYARRSVLDCLTTDESTLDAARKAGFTTALLAPPRAIIGGRAAVVQLGTEPLRRSVLRADVAQTASLEPVRRRGAGFVRGRYPATTLGAMAHLRQFFWDREWRDELRAFVARHADAALELAADPDLEALQSAEGAAPVFIWEVQQADEILRALNLSRELGVKPIIVGGREAWKVADRLKADNVPVFATTQIPDKPREYKWEPEKLRKAAGDSSVFGKNWEERPFQSKAAYDEAVRQRDEQVNNAKQLEAAGVTWCFAGYESKKPADALKNIREMIAAGLPADAALKALTITPAGLTAIDGQAGSVATGKRANLVVFDKPFSEKESQIRFTIVDGRLFEFDAEGDDKKGPGGRGKEGKGGPTSQPATSSAPGSESQPASAPASAPGTQPASSSAPANAFEEIAMHEPRWPIENESMRKPPVSTGGNVFLKNALVLTISGDDLPGTSVLVKAGKIAAIGKDLAAPEGVKTIDLTGYVLMPGILDPHSHIALDDVNEFSGSVTCEVREADVIRHDDRTVFDALAGGCTSIHAMHGSANSIGGQNVILKLKYGRSADEMIFPDAPRTVKWALGENVKRGGMPSPGRFGQPPEILRFPGTRMGVEATLRRALTAGQEYSARRAEYARAKAAGRDVPPLRRDIRLEALADIIDGKLWVNTHCYRHDEILRLMDVAEEFGVRIAALHHVLEGYRIMPEIARHGAGTATFSDWWAYKLEAYDAIPQNAGMLLRAGVNSTIKSDSGELMRHMNLEAAKCMKFSGLTSTEALRLITLNAARLFGLEKHIGSIEVGKDADLAVFDGHPLDTFGRCVISLVDGEVYFVHRDFDPASPKAARRPATTPPTAAKVAKGSGAEPVAAPAPPAAPAYAIMNATIHPVSSPAIERGMLVIRGEKIETVGKAGQAPKDAHVIDAAGLHVWPGLINAATTTGLQEVGQADVTNDNSEIGTFQPDLMAVSAFNPHSRMIDVVRAEGVLLSLVVPEGPLVAGQAGLLRMHGWTTDEMVADVRLGLVVNLPSAPPKPIIEAPPPEDFRRDRAEEQPWEKQLRRTERFFRDAKRYAEMTPARKNDTPPLGAAGSERAAAGGLSEPRAPSTGLTSLRTTGPDIAVSARFEAMRPFISGEKPVLFYVNSYKPMLEALLFAEQVGVRPILVGGRDAWRMADLLAARRVPVIYEGVFGNPREEDEWDCNYRAPAVMAAAGVRFCFGHREADLAKLLPIDAGMAVAHGLDPDAAVRSLTLTSAEILGIADRYGSLDAGKLANVIITTDHVCQAGGAVRYAFIHGKPTPLESQHTRDAAKFANRPAPQLPPARTDLRGPQPHNR
ncbi:hypothetical protein RAS1_06370 [Phycisphaerae bacterium RAS1]|nr:hypothetical protein RAS1_06370 [Phycisphaerae bacterium RAS1]